jgi:hypothetical protein
MPCPVKINVNLTQSSLFYVKIIISMLKVFGSVKKLEIAIWNMLLILAKVIRNYR